MILIVAQPNFCLSQRLQTILLSVEAFFALSADKRIAIKVRAYVFILLAS